MSQRTIKPRKGAGSARPAPTNTRAIKLFFHCRLCVEGPSGPERSDIVAGWTEIGLQVWCRRHDCNILHIDFEGQVHPANLTTAPRPPVVDDAEEGDPN